jgi:bifunctional non-homologous end joining protein LigD
MTVLTSPEKVLWPAAGFTKGAMLEYYGSVAPALLPHLEGKPVTLRRFPDGLEGRSWFQNECPGASRRPSFVRTARVTLGGGREWAFCVIDNEETLLWAANLGTIELHPLLFSADLPTEPRAVVFDLDPGPPAGLAECCRVACRLREVLAETGIRSFPKTSGSVGLHVYVPLGPGHSFAHTKAFARGLAARLAREEEGVVDMQARAQREGKVLVDWGQNDAARSLVAPYSLRAAGWPTVSTPLSRDEVENGSELLVFEPQEVLERIRRLGDLFAPVLSLEQSLP